MKERKILSMYKPSLRDPERTLLFFFAQKIAHSHDGIDLFLSESR